MSLEPGSRHFRTLFISDIHLGTRGCKAEFLLDFLRNHDAETIYLVGDIIDGWSLRRGWYWPQSHNDVVQKLLRKARKGTRVVYVPGNHDEAARQFVELTFGGVEVHNETVHTTADGRRLIVLHGDKYDGVVVNARWLAVLGSSAYEFALALNTVVNGVRRRLGYPYWSLAAFLKHRVKNAVNFISDFERALVGEAKKRGMDGVVCGHIHKPEITAIDGIAYYNDGDWVESCTALAEDFQGNFELLHWTNTETPAKQGVLA